MTNQTLKQLYLTHHGKTSDKWSLYLSEYDRLLLAFRERAIRLLEIGIQNGGSLEVWAKYFPQATNLIGCDINPDCRNLRYDDRRIAIVVGDITQEETKKEILSFGQTYDIIIDDGSHRSSDIIKAFTYYFPHLADGGVFIVEDLHCSYWQEFEGGLFNPFSSITFFKRLADIVSHEHWGIDLTRHKLLESFAAHYNLVFDEEALSHIHSVEFINSVCVIRKASPKDNESGLRRVIGDDALVQPDIKAHNNSRVKALDQSNNIWSVLTCPQDEELIQIRVELAERDRHITELEQALNERDNQIASLLQTATEREAQISYHIWQQSVVNEELMNLHAERASLGARIGREITRLASLVAPINTKRRKLARQFAKFFLALTESGIRSAMAKSARHGLLFLRLTAARRRGRVETPLGAITDDTLSDARDSRAKVQTDHSELEAWIQKHEPTPAELSIQKEEAANFGYRPLISIIVPVYKVPRDVLEETLGSLETQTYSIWQACIVWADIEDTNGWEWLNARTAHDPRFKIRLLAENGGISRNSNAAFELANGEYIALLDHDDTLTPWALFDIVQLLQASPELDYIYSDKDSISADGGMRLNALFKPDWSPEMLHSVNYLTHLNVIRTALVKEIGGWRPETDGAQDWDLFFRITERTQNIARVPSIHYHWRILPTSTATGIAAKPYAALGQLRTQQDYFTRRGISALVMPSPEGMYKVCWPVSVESTDVVIFQNGKLSRLLALLDSLRLEKHGAIRNVYVIHSTPLGDSLSVLQGQWPNRIFLTQVSAANWHKALEVALSKDISKAILLLDGGATGISETLIEELSGWVVQHPDIAWASAIALAQDDTVYEAGRVVSPDYQSAPLFSGSTLSSFGWFGGPLWYRNTRACSPYAVAIKSDDARKELASVNCVNGNRDEFVEFCTALGNSGRRGLIDPFARVYFNSHPEAYWPNDGSIFHTDPYFNPAFDGVSPLTLKS